MAAKSQPIIVIKKKGGHDGHHGGAWKVAYADFVTALMSLFIVLWLMGQSDPVKKAVAGYFNDPRGTGSLLGTTMSGTGSGTGAGAASAADQNQQKLEELKEKLEREIAERKDLEKLIKQIEITITPEGLRIELIEDKNGTFYQSGSARLSPSGQELLALLASELKTLPNQLLIEGHTDAAQYSTNANYSNWELSADRANSARRLLQQDGVRGDQVTQVRGFADQMLRVKSNPYDPSNRRITILVKNQDNAAPPPQFAHATVVVGGPNDANPGAGPGALPAAPKAQSPPASAPATPAKPTAAQPTAKPGIMGKLTSMFTGSKK
ncbi:MAG: flagellar motor protein MotB [Terracidiphilus sp.]|jgi:chemotaxis protein MotB